MNIDEMPAGREMDGQIHVLIFNKAVPTDHDWLHNTFCDCVPRYSTDIAAAWEVVEKVKLLDCHGQQCIGRTLRRECGKWVIAHRWGIDIAHAPTVSLAICRAALKVIKGSSGDNMKPSPNLTTAILSSLPGALRGKLGDPKGG